MTFVALLGSGLVAGIFFASSTFVLRALGQLPEKSGVRAMQAINITVLNPWFLGAFFGTGVVCIALVIVALGQAIGVPLILTLVGSGLYLIGCLLVTIAFNVPLNNRLAAVEAHEEDAAEFWTHYLARWTRWNHVRTAAPLAAAALFALALRWG